MYDKELGSVHLALYAIIKKILMRELDVCSIRFTLNNSIFVGMPRGAKTGHPGRIILCI